MRKGIVILIAAVLVAAAGAALLSLSGQMCGYCYTQLTDVEQEENGVYFYDRSPKFDMSRINAIFSRTPEGYANGL